MAAQAMTWARRVAVAVALVAVSWFYLWTVQTAGSVVQPHGQRGDYYNLLVDGFLDGHLYMKEDPDPRLLALPPEQRPGNAPFKLDASLYEGRYYLYFGVTPVIVLNLPFFLLTGQDLPEALTAVVFMVAGLLVATAWWLGVRRRFFPELGPGWTALGVLAIGLCTAAPSALRRPLFYEVAIGAGFAFAMAALWLATQAWWRPAQRKWWLALAGVAVGLAVGARANLAPPGVLLLCAAALGPAALGSSDGRKGPRWRAVAVGLMLAAGGAAAVGAGLAAYNYARFGSITEFGHNYQLGIRPQQLFRPANLAHNLSLYYFKPPKLSAFFPFVSPPDEGPKPADYVGREHAHGQWVWTLVAVLAAAGAAAAWWRRRGEGVRRRPLLVLALPGLWFVSSGLVVGLTGVRSNRYMVDFQPGLVLVTLGLLAFGLVGLRGWSRFALASSSLLTLVAAMLFNVLASFESHQFFSGTAPVTYGRLARWADGVAWPLLSRLGPLIGDREVIFFWPTHGGRGGREVLLANGARESHDTLFLDYDAAGRVRVIFKHGEYGEAAGEWFPYAGAMRSKIHISGSLLLPGAGHPWYGDRPVAVQDALKRRLRVTVDGRLRFDREMPSYDASPMQMVWGRERFADGTERPAAGWLDRVNPLPIDETWLRGRERATGAMRLKLQLPANRFGWVEPLVQSGGLNAFDALAVRFVRPGVVQLLHDQLGGGGRWSEEFAVDYAQPQWVEVSLPAANDGNLWEEIEPDSEMGSVRLLRVRWNGKNVFLSALPPRPAPPLSVTLGVNWWNASGIRALFNGQMIESPRLEPLPPLRTGVLTCVPAGSGAMADERGVWLQFDRADGLTAGLLWQRMPDQGSTRVGWWEGASVTWLARLEPAEVALLAARVELPERAPAGAFRQALVELEVKGRGAFAHKTEFFNGLPVTARALRPGDWQGSALRVGDAVEPPPAPLLPGRLRLRFILPPGGFTGSDPLLSAGRAGAADSIYLRGLGGGRYRLGVDHWGVGSVETEPFTLAEKPVHTLVIELGSLGVAGELPPNRVRLLVDGQVVLDVTRPLYPVEPGEVVFGKNPLGMSTSDPVFRGEIISVLSRASADDTR